MAIIGDNITSFDGLDERHASSGALIRKADVDAKLIEDNAFCVQAITNTKLSSGAWSGTEQEHTGAPAGCLLGWPLSTVCVRASSADAPRWQDTSIERPLIIPSEIGVDDEPNNVTLYKWPVYVPNGCTRATVVMHGGKGGAHLLGLNPSIKVLSTSFVQEGDTITGGYSPSWASDVDVAFEVPFTVTATVYVLELCATTYTTDTNEYRLDSVHVLPWGWQRSYTKVPESTILYDAGTTAPASTGTYLPIYDGLVANNYPLTSWLTYRMAANDVYAHDLITGIRCPGAEDVAVAGHNHDGSNSKAIVVPLYSTCHGWCASSTLTYGLPTTGGYWGNCPSMSTTAASTFAACAWGILPLPTRAADWTLNFAATLCDTGGNTGSIRFDCATDASPWVIGTPVDFSGSGWRYATGTITIPSGTSLIYYRMCMDHDHDKDNDPIHFTGHALWG